MLSKERIKEIQTKLGCIHLRVGYIGEIEEDGWKHDKFTCVLTYYKPSWYEDGELFADKRCVVGMVTVPFSMGTGLRNKETGKPKAPKMAHVMACVVADWETFNEANNGAVDDFDVANYFMCEFGYTDIRKVGAIIRAMRQTVQDMVRIFGAQWLNDFMEIMSKGEFDENEELLELLVPVMVH